MEEFYNANERVAAGKRLAVSPAEAALLVGIGRTKLYQALNAGVLPSFKIGTRRLVRIAEIEAWLQRLEEAARQDARHGA